MDGQDLTLSKMRTQSAVFLLLALWVISADAWFWSWTGTTTLAPTVDNEGSGSPVGSGELPSENIATVGQEIIDEAHRIQKLVQTWDETTEAPQLTTTAGSQPGPAPEMETAEISSNFNEPGKGTSSQKGISSEATDFLKFAENESRLGPGLEFRLVSDTEGGNRSVSGPGNSSVSGFETGPETSWGSGPEMEIVRRSKQGEFVHTDNRKLDHRDSEVSTANGVKLNPQKTTWVAGNKTDEGHKLVSAKSEQNIDLSPQNGGQNIKLETSSMWNTNNSNLSSYPLENFNQGKPNPTAEVNDSVDTNRLTQKMQTGEITKLPAGESTAKPLLYQVSHTTPALFTRQALSPTQTAISTSHVSFSPLQTTSRKATSENSSAQPQVLSQVSAAKHRVITSQMDHNENATQKSLPLPASRQAALRWWEPVKSHEKLAKPPVSAESPQCLLLETSLPFCSFVVGQRFVVPNYLNHSTVEEVHALLNDWAWLLRSQCHHSLEWFFCLLLVPKCGPVALLPCRSFCEVLKDSCWTLLDEGHLPVECHALPEEEEEEDGYQCLSVSNQKGNH